MIGVVVVTHGNLSKSIVDTAKMFHSEFENVEYLMLKPSSNLDEYEKMIYESYHRVNQGEGVLFLADLFGGTPANKVLKLILNKEDIHCVTGLNLGMFLEVVLSRKNMKLNELTDLALEAGIVGIKKLEM